MTAEYPKPDRSAFTPNLRKTEANDALDIGWAEGALSDGRPYRLECWAQDQMTSVTIFVAISGLENLGNVGIQALLEEEGLVHFLGPKRFVSALPIRDPSGQHLLSINVVIRDQNETYAGGGPALQPYSERDAHEQPGTSVTQ